MIQIEANLGIAQIFNLSSILSESLTDLLKRKANEKERSEAKASLEAEEVCIC